MIQNWAYIFVGLILTLPVLSCLFKHLSRTRTIENLVNKRTDELRQSEQRWQFALEGSRDGVWDWNTKTNEVFFSNQWKLMLGYEVDEISNTLEEWDKRIHPDDKEKVYADLERHMSGKCSFYQNEYRMLCKDGHFKWILDRGKVIERDQDGKSVRVIGTHSDISERMRAERALQQSEIQQRTILETVADAIITINDKGIIITFNLAAEKMFDYTATEAIGKYLSSLLPKFEQNSHEDFIRYSKNDASHIVGEVRKLFGIRKDRTHFPLELNIGPIELAGELGFVCTLRDLTERNRAQQALNQFKTTLDRTLDCVFMFEPVDLKFIYVNAGAMQQVGYSYDEMMNMTPFDIKPEYDEQRFRETIAPMIANKQPVMNFETLHQNKNGHTVPVDIFLQYINPAGETPRFVAIVRDISEQKRVDKMKNEFVSTVSHELRTPLTSIRGSLGLITGGATGELPKQAKEMLKIAENNTQRLLLLINDILDIQKIELGEMAFQFQRLELMPFMEKAIEDNRGYGDQYLVSFKITQRIESVSVFADPNRLMQVMSNLLSNAAKFSAEGDTVELQVTHHNNAVRIAITDHGPGIPEEFQPKLFDKFTQADSTDTRKVGGTGLGLSIAKTIILEHGGSIDFVSKLGIGTTIFVDMPKLVNKTEVTEQKESIK